MTAGAVAAATIRWLGFCATFGALPALAQSSAGSAGTESAPGTRHNATLAGCQALVPVPWPATLIERRLQLRRMDATRDACIGHAGFLAALGALWLEDGDPEQARVWLERSLMLDPDSIGAQADHALALAALGEPTALRELSQAWQRRTDIPMSLQQRIASALDPGAATRLPTARLGGMTAPQRASRGEASVVAGYESNLTASPRLTELTITLPGEDPIAVPVDNATRQGGALKLDLAWQTAWETEPRQIVRTGVALAARHAPGEGATDWHQLQAGVSLSQQWNGWTGTAQADLAWFGGRLTEPYGLLRTQLALEQVQESCSHGAQVDLTLRRQSETRSADSQAASMGWRIQCRPAAARQWLFGLNLRGGIDRPRSADRPGGSQRSLGMVLRTEFRPNPLLNISLSVGAIRTRDSEGYSEILSNGAIRTQTQQHVALELSHAVNWQAIPGAEAVLNLSRFVQDSNLELFRHSGVAAYAGLRWPW